MKKTQLDRLLQDWARGRRTTPETHDELLKGIGEQLRRRPLMGLPAPAPARPRPAVLWGSRLGWAAVGAAAASLVFCCVYQGPLPCRSTAGRATPGAAVRAPWPRTPGAGSGSEGLVRTINELFCDRLLWLAETDDDVEIGLAADGAPVPPVPGPLIAVDVFVRSRTGPEAAWRQARAVRVVTRPEQVIQTTFGAKSASRLVLWAYALEDGALAVDSKLELRSPVDASVTASRIFVSDRPLRVFSLQTDTLEFQVLQAAAVVPNGGVGSENT